MSEAAHPPEVQLGNITQEISERAYALASRLVVESAIDQHTQLTPKGTIDFIGSLHGAVREEVAGHDSPWRLNRTFMRESLWYAAQLTLNPSLVEATRINDSKRIRRHARLQDSDIDAHYSRYAI
jgi:hypothetical protein